MVYTDEQVREVKRQIFEQTKNMPDAQRKAIEEQVNKMTPEQLEAFVAQQMSASQGGGEEGGRPQKGIFRMIIDGEVPSRKVNENKEAIAVISVRAVSKGHILIIPKKPVGDANSMPQKAYTLARQVAKRIVDKMDAKSTAIQTENAFGEVVIDVIPIYDKPLSVTSQRYEVQEKELDEVYTKLKVVKKPKIERIKMKKETKELGEEKILKLKRRVP